MNRRLTSLLGLAGGLSVLAVAAFVWMPHADAPIDDLRFHNPRATLFTFLDCYGVADLPQKEILRRMEIGRTFHLNDPATRDECFVDYEGPQDEGLVGYVFGGLAPVKDDLVISGDERVAHTIASDDAGPTRPVVLHRTDLGWKIHLRESVPRSVQRQLEEAAAQAR